MKVCILFSPRSGSHLLASLLEANGIKAGYEILFQSVPNKPPTEGDILPTAMKNDLPWLQFRNIVDECVERYAENGNYSLNVSRNLLNTIFYYLGVHNNSITTYIFLRYVFHDFRFVYLYRRDILDQLISNLFIENGGKYSREKFASRFDQMHNRREFFAFHDLLHYLPMFEITYEDLVRDPSKALSGLGSYLPFDLSVTKQTQFQKRDQETKISMKENAISDMVSQMYSGSNVSDEEQVDVMRVLLSNH